MIHLGAPFCLYSRETFDKVAFLFNPWFCACESPVEVN